MAFIIIFKKLICFSKWFQQDGLKRRLDKLKKNIEEATAAVEQEREKNVSLLHLIFPPDIAKRLWLGKLGVYFICPGPDWIKSAGGSDQQSLISHF